MTSSKRPCITSSISNENLSLIPQLLLVASDDFNPQARLSLYKSLLLVDKSLSEKVLNNILYFNIISIKDVQARTFLLKTHGFIVELRYLLYSTVKKYAKSNNKILRCILSVLLPLYGNDEEYKLLEYFLNLMIEHGAFFYKSKHQVKKVYSFSGKFEYVYSTSNVTSSWVVYNNYGDFLYNTSSDTFEYLNEDGTYSNIRFPVVNIDVKMKTQSLIEGKYIQVGVDMEMSKQLADLDYIDDAKVEKYDNERFETIEAMA